MSKPYHLVVSVNGHPGEDIIHLGAVLYDRYFTEDFSRFSIFIRPNDTMIPEALMASIGVSNRDELATRMMYWESFPAAMRAFQSWAMRKARLGDWDATSSGLVWTGMDIHKTLHYLALTAKNNDFTFLAEEVQHVLSLSSVTQQHESALAYLGWNERVYGTLTETCEHLKVTPPDMEDAVSRCVATARCFHKMLVIQKTAYERALKSKNA
jgi:hypothetical protein